MTFHSTITKAQPFPFSPLAISLGQTDGAVVTIRKALAEMPAGMANSTLEELNPSIAASDAAAGWDDLMARWREARSEQQRLGSLHSAAERRYIDLLPERPLEPDAPSSVGLEDIKNMTLAQIAATKVETHPAWIEYEAAKAVREKACAGIRVSSGFSEVEDAWEAAAENCAALARQLIMFPVPDLSYLPLKLEVIHEEFGSPEDYDFECIMADVTRLSAPAGAGQQVN